MATVGPLDPNVPDRLARTLAADGRPHRVLNDYNVGGALILFGEGRLRVTIDGRADYYGGPGITRHLEFLALRPGWQARLSELAPDSAVLTRATPLTGALLDRGWTEVASQGRYVLLLPPTP